MLLSSVLITSGNGDGNANLSPILRENIASLKRHHSDLTHKMFLREDASQLIKNKFPSEVWAAYCALMPCAYQADLARYCILYEYGGLYADLSYYFVAPIPMPEGRGVVFRGNLVSAPWDTSNGLMFLPPKHKALKHAIDLICANVQRRYYGLSALCPTGPALFGKALAATCEAEELITGLAALIPRAKVEQLAPDLQLPQGSHIHCQTLGGKLVAVKRKRLLSPGLVEFGITTGNSYRDLWKNREVYN